MEKPIVYTTPTCKFCILTKAYFKENGIEFEEKDVATDVQARQEMVEKSGQLGVPVTVIGENVVVGFDKGMLEELIKKENG